MQAEAPEAVGHRARRIGSGLRRSDAVVEGWNALDLHDAEIDGLLTSANVEHLRRYRNGTFHFQQAYLDPRVTEIMGSPDSVDWVRRLLAARKLKSDGIWPGKSVPADTDLSKRLSACEGLAS